MIRQQCKILEVYTRELGDFLEQDALVSDTSLVVDLPFDFPESGGQALIVDTDQVVTFDYVDYDTSVLYLNSTTPVSASAAQYSQVRTYPLSEERIAIVDIGDEQEPFEVSIPYNMQIQIPDGIRDEEFGYEFASLELDGDTWRLLEVYGQPASINFTSISTPPTALSDGFTPTTSPTPTTVGGLQQIFVRWEAVLNTDPVTYEVHVSTSNATPPVAGDPTTLVEETASTFISTRVLPDGTNLKYNTDTENPNDPDPAKRQIYYFSVIAKDADGPADPSDWVAGSIDLTAEGDIVAGSVTAELLAGVLAIFSRLEIGGSQITISPPTMDGTTPVGGIEVFNSAGEAIVQLHPEGCFIQGRLIADVLTVLTELQILLSAELSQGATFELKNMVKNPNTAPTLSQGSLVAQPFPAGLPAGYNSYGIAWDAGTSCWFQLIWSPTTKNAHIRKINTSGSVLSTTFMPQFADSVSIFSGLSIVSNSVEWAMRDTAGTYQICINDKNDGSTITSIESVEVPVKVFTDSTQSDFYLLTRNGSTFTVYRDFGFLGGGSAVLSSFSSTSIVYGVMIGDFGYGSDKLAIFYRTSSGTVLKEKVFNMPTTWTGETISSVSDLDRPLMPIGTYEVAQHPTHGVCTRVYGSTDLNHWSNYLVSSDGTWASKYADTKISDTPDHTTAVSPTSDNLTVESRSFVTVSLPPLASGTEESDVWVGYGNGTTPSTFYKRPETLTGRTLVLTSLKSTSGTASAPDPSKTLFPAGDSAHMFSEAGDFEVFGDGTGQWPLISVVSTKARKTATQSTTTAVTETVGQSGETYGAYDGSGTSGDTDYYTENNGVFTITVAGVYVVNAFVIWAANATGIRIATIALNGARTAQSVVPSGSGTTETAHTVTTGPIVLAASDTIALTVLQNSGGNLNVGIGSYLSITRLGSIAP